MRRIFVRLISAAAALGLMASPALAGKTPTEINTEIDTLLADNRQGLITEAVIRAVLKDIAAAQASLYYLVSTCTANQWVSGFALTGAPNCTRPSFSSLSGSISPGQMIAAGAGALGGVYSSSAQSNQFATGIDTTGSITYAQPAFSNLSGSIAASQLIPPTLTTLGAVKAFTGTTSQWPWQLNTDGTWITKSPVNGSVLTNYSGVDATGATDSTTGIQTAATATPSSGGVLYVGAGTYKVTAPVYLPNNTSVKCAPGATFKPTTGFSVFATPNYNRNILTDTTATSSAAQTDHDISIEGCAFDFSSVSVASGGPTGDVAAAFSAYLAKRVSFIGNYAVGGSVEPSTVAMMRCIASDKCSFLQNTGSGVGIGFDAWQGFTNATAQFNKISVASNPSAWGNLYCFGLNGVGTNASNQQASSGFTVSNNFCETNGTAGGVQYDALGPGSSVANGVIENNVINAASGTGNLGIYARGKTYNVKVAGNKLTGQTGFPVYLGGYYSTGSPFTCTGCLATTSGSSSVVVTKSTMDLTTVAIGNYIYFNSASAVGGLTLASGQYPVIAVNPGVSITINAGSNASSTTSGGGSVSFNVFWGTASYSQVLNNTFYGVSNAGSALVYVSGPGNVIGGNSGISGTYGAFVYADSLLGNAAATPVPYLWGNSAPAGSGIGGTSGDNVNAYSSVTVPLILDNAGLKDRTNTWASAQTFSAPPIFTTLTGYIKGNGGSAATAAAGVPVGDLSGLGTGVASALAVNVGSVGAPVVNGGALGTPSSGTLTNATGLPVSGIAAIADGTLLCNTSGSSAAPTACKSHTVKDTTGPSTTYSNTANTRTMQVGVNDNFNGVVDVGPSAVLLLKTNGATAATVNVSGTASTSPSTGAYVVAGGIGASDAIYAAKEVTGGLVAVASLPACNSARRGARMAVSDGAAALAWGANISSGSTVVYGVFCNGSNWTVEAK